MYKTKQKNKTKQNLLAIFWSEMWFILITPLLILMASKSNVSWAPVQLYKHTKSLTLKTKHALLTKAVLCCKPSFSILILCPKYVFFFVCRCDCFHYFFTLAQIRLQFQMVSAPNQLAAINYNMICATIDTDEYCSQSWKKRNMSESYGGSGFQPFVSTVWKLSTLNYEVFTAIVKGEKNTSS